MNPGLIGALFAAKEIVGPIILTLLIVGVIGIGITLFLNLFQKPIRKKRKYTKRTKYNSNKEIRF